ncbi:trimethylamine--corrinoid methyltransferase, partial [Sinorhizobium meliloti]
MVSEWPPLDGRLTSIRLGRLAPVDEAELNQIERATDKVLADVGLRFEGDPETLALWREHGMPVQEDRVFLDGAWLRSVIRATAPPTFRLRARNPVHDTIVGPDAPPIFAPIYGAPNLQFVDQRRGLGSRKEYRKLVALAHQSPALSNTGHMICVMNDIPEAARPVHMALAHLECSDKPFMGCIASPAAAQTVIEMVKLAIGREEREAECSLLHLINATPPLTYKENPLRCLRAIARNQQGIMVTSYMMMGATSPVTIAGTLIQGYAEVLAGLALAQLWFPGTPVVFGLFAIPFSMRSMLPVFGDPASQLVQLYSVQLARRLGIPVRGDGGVTSSNADDGQAGYEGGRATSVAATSGADFILHAAGWLEQGRCVSIGKFGREARAIAEMYGRAAEPMPHPDPLDGAIAAELHRRA